MVISNDLLPGQGEHIPTIFVDFQSARSHWVAPCRLSSIKITFQDSKGQTVTQVEGNEGDDLLSLAHEWDVDLEGACEGSIACSTCHVILDAESYDKLEEPEDDENDMLDLAFGLSDT
jgi:ferredoxin